MKLSKIIYALLLSTLIVATLSACTTSNSKAGGFVSDADIVALSYKAADLLMEQAGDKIKPNSNTIVASYADINNLSVSSTFGRIAAQQVASRLTQRGHKITEMLLRKDIYIQERQGEFVLSRALKNISVEHDVTQVVVGTYAVASRNIYITAKLIRSSDSEILGSVDYTLPLGPDMRQLTRN
jgi:TolB-like protein